MEKTASNVLILLTIIALGAVCLEPVCAQSAKPSAPKFSARFPTTGTIQIVVENQAFTGSSAVNSIVYYYRVKDHNSNQWVICGNYQLQSDSQTTLIKIPPYPTDISHYLFPPNNMLNHSNSLDFQVQAVSGYYQVKYVQGQMPGAPLQTNGYSETTFNKSETSDWSDTVTVNIDGTATFAPSSTPSLIPTPSPELNLTSEPPSFPTGNPTETSFKFKVSAEDKTYPVTADSNSTVTDLTFNPAIKELDFKANGQTGTTGYCRITIPTTLLGGELSIYKDEVLLVKNVDYTQSNDGTNNILQITYNHSTHDFKIVGTQTIPEFSSRLILIGLMGLISLSIFTLGRRKVFSKTGPAKLG